jgi:hypothetical protein
MSRRHFAAALFLAVLGASAAGLPAGAEERPTRREVWDLKLGADIAGQPDDFIDYACGTNGGPPGLQLTGWKDFRRCRPDASGLREVYFRYDDEIEYWAKANNLEGQMEQYVGTKTYGFPITVSALIDEAGIVRGVRIVTDPRDPTGDRDEAYLLRNFLNARLGRDNWTCDDQAAADGETAPCSSRDICASPARANTIRTPARRRPTSSRAMSASNSSAPSKHEHPA